MAGTTISAGAATTPVHPGLARSARKRTQKLQNRHFTPNSGEIDRPAMPMSQLSLSAARRGLIMATIDRASPMAAHESDFNGGPSADELKARGYPPRNSGLTAEVSNHRRCALALSVGHCLLTVL